MKQPSKSHPSVRGAIRSKPIADRRPGEKNPIPSGQVGSAPEVHCTQGALNLSVGRKSLLRGLRARDYVPGRAYIYIFDEAACARYLRRRRAASRRRGRAKEIEPSRNVDTFAIWRWARRTGMDGRWMMEMGPLLVLGKQ